LKLVTVRRVIAALMLSFSFVLAGELDARAGSGKADLRAKTSRGSWAVVEARRQDPSRLVPLRAKKVSGVKSAPRMGLTAFSRAGDGRRISVLHYQTPLSVGPGDMMLTMRAPGGRGSFVRVELEF